MSESVSGRAALAMALFRAGAIRFGKSTLPSGRTTSYHLDLRVVSSDPEAYGLAIAACKVLAESIGFQGIEAIAGVGIAGTALASPLAHLLKKPLLCVVEEEARGGTDSIVWGAPRPRWRTLVISDEAAGQRVVQAIEALREAGCVVTETIALVDRQEGGKARLEAIGVRLHAFVDIRGLATILFENKVVTKANYEAALKQIDEPD